METLQRAFEYQSWSNQRIFDVVDTLITDISTDVSANEQTLAFITQQLNHLIIVEDLFRARLLSEPAPHHATNDDQLPEYGQIKRRLLESAQWYLSFTQNMSADSANDRYQFDFADGQAGDMTVLEVLFHIVQHGAYHRGSIARALDLAGIEHPADSFTIYLHQAEPERRLQGQS